MDRADSSWDGERVLKVQPNQPARHQKKKVNKVTESPFSISGKGAEK